MAQRSVAPWIYIVSGGLIVGTLDIAFACIFWAIQANVTVQQIFQSVAAGLLGDATYEGGAATAALGLGLHYFIATSMSLAFYLVAVRRPALVGRPVAYGIAYGLLLYVIMNYIVVPLSAANPGPKRPLWIGLSIAVHALLIGVPIALCARGALRQRHLIKAPAGLSPSRPDP